MDRVKMSGNEEEVEVELKDILPPTGKKRCIRLKNSIAPVIFHQSFPNKLIFCFGD